MSDWDEIRIAATVASASDVAALIADEVAEAAQGVELRGGEVAFWVARERRDAALAETRAAVERLAAAGMAVDPAGVESVSALPESAWRDVWKQHFHVTRLTRQLLVVPSWEQHAASADDRVIGLDPGQAFGTGLHASTRLVLLELQALCDGGFAPARVLDVGCGSGILAIAAALLWPGCRAQAEDIDPLAVSASEDNVARNQLADRISCRLTDEHGPGGAEPGTFALVLANIQAAILRDMAAPLTARVAAGGRLLLSGILTAQAEGVAERLAEAGALAIESLRRSDDDPEWTSVVLTRPA